VAGVRCIDDQDCLVGNCVPIGEEGFTACTIPCASDDDCTIFDGARGYFICGEPVDGVRTCISDEIFTGTLCADDSQCRPTERCVRRGVSGGSTDIGYCYVPCPDGTCAPRAGIPHTCRTDGDIPYCYPAKIGVPCGADTVCVGNLSCSFIPGDLDQVDEPITTPVCTYACLSDADCAANRFTPSSWCNNGFCSTTRGGGRICPRDGACVSGTCAGTPERDAQGQLVSRCTQPQPISI